MGSLGALRRGSLVTVVLVFGFLTLLLLGIVIVVDAVLNAHGFPYSLLVVALLAFLFMALQWLIAPVIVRWAIRGRREVTPQTNPWLHGTVTALAKEAGVPVPRIWVSSDGSPNAFVFGRTVATSELVVTQGLLDTLTAEEIRAVVGHEIGHLRHRDVVIMTWVSAVPLLAYIIARFGLEAMRGMGRSRGKGGEAALIAAFVALISYVVYLVTQLLVLYLSRTREYYADAYSAAATRDPHLLASALTKISYGLSLAREDPKPSGLRAFFIGDPVKAAQDYSDLQQRMDAVDLDRDGQLDAFELQRAVEIERKNHWRRANELFSTHPPTFKRILMLEEIEEEMKAGGLPRDVYKFV